ncbi:MAG TPA: hypothetical protein VFK85_07095 [Anaeromyxobacteraceae bacterium]|nr:hypothetical protein [Anaeromyxobacteraceae bacterium]
MGQDRDRKVGPPGIAATLSAAVRTAMRRARPDAPTPPPQQPAPPATTRVDPDRALDIAEERAASRDLLAIDSVVRRFYSLASGSEGAREWDQFRALFHDSARVGTGTPDPTSTTGMDDVPIDRLVERERATGSRPRAAERSRTVHVLGDLAVVISAFEVERGAPAGAGRGVNVMQLRLWRDRGWLIQSVVARPVERAITEKSADPRPLASRRD